MTAPRTPTEATIARIWSELLGVANVGVHDDFFELGGDSLMAVEMFARLADELGRDLPVGALGRGPTVAALAALVGDADVDAWSPLVPIRPDGDRAPLFCFHGGLGNVASFPLLARQLPADRPVYAFQWDGLRGAGGSRTVETMADRYLAEIRRVRPHGPYLLAGQCIGGLVARVIARRLLDDGDDVPLVVMWDTPNLASPHYVLDDKRPKLERLLRSPSRAQAVVALKRMDRPVLEYHLRRILLRQIRDPELHRFVTVRSAAWRHRPEPLPVRTLYVGGVVHHGPEIGLDGHWTDGALGWAHQEGPDFVILHVDAGHNDVPYHPDAVAALAAELERADPAGAR
jgi:thioesterase domain-containing protein/acyl carrier protein